MAVSAGSGSQYRTKVLSPVTNGAPALSHRDGVVQIWLVDRSHRVGTISVAGTTTGVWSWWADDVRAGIAAAAGVV